MTFVKSVSVCLQKYATFSGRASRSEYWWFVLFCLIGGLLLGFVDGFFRGFSGLGSPFGLVTLPNLLGLAMLLPSLAVTIRRLHDIGWSGWWVLFPIVVGAIGGGLAGGIVGYLTETGILSGDLTKNASIAGGIVGMLAGFFFLYLFIRPSQPGPNRYGPNPNEVMP